MKTKTAKTSKMSKAQIAAAADARIAAQKTPETLDEKIDRITAFPRTESHITAGSDVAGDMTEPELKSDVAAPKSAIVKKVTKAKGMKVTDAKTVKAPKEKKEKKAADTRSIVGRGYAMHECFKGGKTAEQTVKALSEKYPINLRIVNSSFSKYEATAKKRAERAETKLTALAEKAAVKTEKKAKKSSK